MWERFGLSSPWVRPRPGPARDLKLPDIYFCADNSERCKGADSGTDLPTSFMDMKHLLERTDARWRVFVQAKYNNCTGSQLDQSGEASDEDAKAAARAPASPPAARPTSRKRARTAAVAVATATANPTSCDTDLHAEAARLDAEAARVAAAARLDAARVDAEIARLEGAARLQAARKAAEAVSAPPSRRPAARKPPSPLPTSIATAAQQKRWRPSEPALTQISCRYKLPGSMAAKQVCPAKLASGARVLYVKVCGAGTKDACLRWRECVLTKALVLANNNKVAVYWVDAREINTIWLDSEAYCDYNEGAGTWFTFFALAVRKVPQA